MQTAGFLVLIVGVVVFILLYGMNLRARRDQRLAALYEKALAQGIDPRLIRFEFDEREAGDPQGNLKAGIILLAAAAAMLLGLWSADYLPGSFRLLGFALIPAAIGLACLFIHFGVPRLPRPPAERSVAPPAEPPAGQL